VRSATPHEFQGIAGPSLKDQSTAHRLRGRIGGGRKAVTRAHPLPGLGDGEGDARGGWPQWWFKARFDEPASHELAYGPLSRPSRERLAGVRKRLRSVSTASWRAMTKPRKAR